MGGVFGCLLDKGADWATRSVIEAKQWKNNCFITLTYNNENIPKVKGTNKLTLKKRDLQLFFKRLRKHHKGIESRIWKEEFEYPIRYFACGEYGTQTKRPHYHIGIFNWIPDDLKPLTENKYGDILFTSKEISKLWENKGFVTVGAMTYESASYIARYTLKKIHENKEIYKDTGQEKEFVETSRRGGIGINGFTNEKEFEKIKNNMCVITKNKQGIKFKKIPQFIKNKWKEQDRLEYFEKTDKEREKTEKAIKEKMAKSDMEIDEYIRKQKQILVAKIHNAKTKSRKAV